MSIRVVTDSVMQQNSLKLGSYYKLYSSNSFVWSFGITTVLWTTHAGQWLHNWNCNNFLIDIKRLWRRCVMWVTCIWCLHRSCLCFHRQTNIELRGLHCWVHRTESRVQFGSNAWAQQSRFNNVCFHLFCLCQLPKLCVIRTKSKTIKKNPVCHLKFQGFV